MADIVTFDPVNLIITEVSAGGDNELDVLEIYSEWKDWLLADSSRLGYPPAFRVVGGDPITALQALGSTFFIRNGWRIRPAELSHRLVLVGNIWTDPEGFSVFTPVLGAYTVTAELQVSNLVDSISARAQNILSERAIRRIEGLRPDHQGTGPDSYVDPIDGSDTNDGLLPASAFKTIAAAVSAALDGGNTVIWVLNNSTGQLVITERVNLNKNRVLLRGSGPNTVLKNPDDTDAGIILDGSGVAVEGFRIEPATGAAQPAVRHTGKDNMRIQDCQIDAATAEGIKSSGGERHVILNVQIEDCVGFGIDLTDTTNAAIDRVTVQRCTGGGIHLAATGPMMHIATVVGSESVIHNNGVAGMQVDAMVMGTIIHASVHIRGTSSRIVDNGMNTHDETVARRADTVTAIWAHTITAPTAGTVGAFMLESWRQLGLDSVVDVVADANDNTITVGAVIQDVTIAGGIKTISRRP